MKNIREVGSYEIVIYNSDDHRIKEIVVSTSLSETRQTAKSLVKGTDNSFTISRVIDNSKYSKWKVNHEK